MTNSIKYAFLYLLIFTTQFVYGQWGFRGANRSSIEFGIMLGASNYIGDLNGQTFLLSQTHPSGAILGRYNINERWAVKGFVGYGRISGADSLSSKAADKLRNLSFQSDIFEVSVHFELNLIRNKTGYNSNKKVIPYLFAGVGLFNFNPKAKLNGNWYELQPLGTEGQNTTEYNDRTKYALTQFSIPFGVGLKKRLGRHFTFGIEAGLRYTFTNYVDDIGSTYANNNVVRRGSGEIAALLADRSASKSGTGFPVFVEGNPRSRKSMTDMYILSGLTLTYRFLPKGQRCPTFN